MAPHLVVRGLLSFSGALAFSLPAFADIEIQLKQSFIEEYKFKVTMSCDFIIDKAHAKPNAPSKDGDLHISGRSPEKIGLAAVAEIMNAKSSPSALDFIKVNTGTGKSVPMTGVWRLWSEHAGNEKHVQGKPLAAFNTTNPDHLFELHPVTKVGSIDLLSTLVPIQGYDEKLASSAFKRFESTKFRMEVNTGGTVSLFVGAAGYNYVKFVVRPDRSKMILANDGFLMPCDFYGLDKQLLVKSTYVVAPKGSVTYDAMLKLKPNQGLTILGTPRMSLARLSWRIKNVSKVPKSEVLTWGLPYEMIAVGNYGTVDF